MNAATLRLLLRPAPGSAGVVVIPAVAFAVVSALVLTVVGGAQAFWRWTDEYAMIYQILAAVALNPDSQTPKDAKVLSKPFHLRELVNEVEKLLAA